jgi:hypothetical protein
MRRDVTRNPVSGRRNWCCHLPIITPPPDQTPATSQPTHPLCTRHSGHHSKPLPHLQTQPTPHTKPPGPQDSGKGFAIRSGWARAVVRVVTGGDT